MKSENATSNQVSPGLLMGVGPGCDEPLNSKLFHCLARSPREALGIEQLAAGLQQEASGSHGLLVYRDPVSRVTELILEGNEPALAAAQWRSEADSVLNLFERFPARVTLANLENVLAGFDRFIALLKPRVPFPLRLAGSPVGDLGPAYPPVYQLLAGFLIHSDEQCLRTLRELEAASLPLQSALVFDVSAYLASVETQAGPAETGDIEFQDAKGVLQFQLVETQQELERLAIENAQLKSTLARATNDLTLVLDSLSWRMTAPVRKVLGVFMDRGSKRADR